jgi:hypothetical protein
VDQVAVRPQRGELRPDGAQHLVDREAHADGEQGTGEQAPQRERMHAGMIPHEQHGERRQRDDDHAGLQGPHRVHQLGEGVLLAAGEPERLVALVVAVAPERVGDLLEDDDDADGRQHPADDAGREQGG